MELLRVRRQGKEVDLAQWLIPDLIPTIVNVFTLSSPNNNNNSVFNLYVLHMAIKDSACFSISILLSKL